MENFVEAPLGVGGVRRLSWQRSESEIVESAFRSLEIEGRSETAEVELAGILGRVASTFLFPDRQLDSLALDLAGRPTAFAATSSIVAPRSWLRTRQEGRFGVLTRSG